MSTPDLLQLRETLLKALETYHAGPRNILLQICLAISGLALQLPAWEDPVQDMIDAFGRNPATVPALLQFLTVLPEEITTNTKIPITVCGTICLRSSLRCQCSCRTMNTQRGRQNCLPRMRPK